MSERRMGPTPEEARRILSVEAAVARTRTEEDTRQNRIIEQSRCQMTCPQLLDVYGSQRPNSREYRLALNIHEQRLDEAQMARNSGNIAKAAEELNCLEKWRLKCIPEVQDMQATRKRIEAERKAAGMPPIGERAKR